MPRQTGKRGPLGDLAARWYAEAAALRTRYADERAARLCEVHAEELERAAAAQEQEVLSLAEAAHASGFSEGHLRALIAAGDLTNVGRRYRPRVLRGELPRKPGYQPPVPTSTEPPAAPVEVPSPPVVRPAGRRVAQSAPSARGHTTLSPQEMAALLPRGGRY